MHVKQSPGKSKIKQGFTLFTKGLKWEITVMEWSFVYNSILNIRLLNNNIYIMIDFNSDLWYRLYRLHILHMEK